MKKRDLIVVGGGPAGMSAALAAHQAGVKDILIIERDQYLGGILNQCIHPGFGLHHYKEELTGPEYAYRLAEELKNTAIEISLQSFVVKLEKNRKLTYLKLGKLETLQAKAIIFATGCRERTREMIHISGTRPAGIYPAGLAQKMLNIEGLLPGKEIVIIGSGDIGLIMARRLTLEGAKIKAVVEIQPQSKGLIRNVVQCLEDFDIPLYFNHRISFIHGKDRVEKVTVENTKTQETFELTCDTVLISAGLIPERDVFEQFANEPGIFACGNAAQVYDIVDNVSKDSAELGKKVAEYINKAPFRRSAPPSPSSWGRKNILPHAGGGDVSQRLTEGGL